MKHTDINLRGFEGREEELKRIYRYSNFEDFYYRSNVFTHCVRLFYLLQSHRDIIEMLFPQVNFDKVLVMSLVHDDVEILIGDFASASRLKCSQKQVDVLDEKEANAIKIIAQKFPQNLAGYNYEELLTEIFEHKGLEAQLVKFFDHLDGFGEALHEYFAGNTCVTIQPNTEYGMVLLPFDYYVQRFKKAEQKYPLLSEVFRKTHDFYTPFTLDSERINVEKTVMNYKPHSFTSIQQSFQYEFYDFWKDSVLNSGEKSIVDALTNFSDGRYYNKKTGNFSQTKQ